MKKRLFVFVLILLLLVSSFSSAGFLDFLTGNQIKEKFLQEEGKQISHSKDNLQKRGLFSRIKSFLNLQDKSAEFAKAPAIPISPNLQTPPSCTFQQLTNDNYADLQPRIFEDYIVWQGDDGNDFEIYLYDITNQIEIPLTNNQYGDSSPDIYEDFIVWSGNGEIYLYNLNTGNAKKLTKDGGVKNNIFPLISKDKIVWTALNNSGGSELYFLDINTGSITLIPHSEGAINKQMNNDYIIWNKRPNPNQENQLYSYNFSTGISTQITNTQRSESYFDLYDNKIVWNSIDLTATLQNKFIIKLYDMGTNLIIDVANNVDPSAQPKIFDDYIVWHDDSIFRDIYLYEISSGITTTITNDQIIDLIPIIQDNFVVWQKQVYNNMIRELYLYDIDKGLTIPITSSGNDFSSPYDSYENKFVGIGHFDNSGNNYYEIYLFECS